MNGKNYKSLVYFIAATIMATVALQVYWNVQHYRMNKQRLINDVQISLDNGIEHYFADLARNDFFTFIEMDREVHDTPEYMVHMDTIFRDSIFLQIERDTAHFPSEIHGFTQLLDSGRGVTHLKSGKSSVVSIFRGKNKADSIASLQGLTNKIMVSIIRDSMDYKKLDTLLGNELKRKNIQIGYKIKHLRNGITFKVFDASTNRVLPLSTISKSTYLPEDEQLQLAFTNPTLSVLKRGLTGILLSFLLSACIIACLLYLLHIIRQQKQLAEMKNDLISNITHEFKTPIATVATAIEGIKNFNREGDATKTEKYLDASQQQLKKLDHMVEKLLETATLDSNQLLLQKEGINLVQLLQELVDKYTVAHPEKSISFQSTTTEHQVSVDVFHFENAIANLLDNAIKYGGNRIEIRLGAVLDQTEIVVADNGQAISNGHRERIFDKFYRIPTGNRHDVKGFGIGLYYTRKIVQKHGGTISLAPGENTIFKIVL